MASRSATQFGGEKSPSDLRQIHLDSPIGSAHNSCAEMEVVYLVLIAAQGLVIFARLQAAARDLEVELTGLGRTGGYPEHRLSA